MCLWVKSSHCFEGLCHCPQWQSSCTDYPWTWSWHDAKNPTLQHSITSLMNEVLSIPAAVSVFVKITVLDSGLLTLTHFHGSESECDHMAGMSVFCYSSATAQIILSLVKLCLSVGKVDWFHGLRNETPSFSYITYFILPERVFILLKLHVHAFHTFWGYFPLHCWCFVSSYNQITVSYWKRFQLFWWLHPN